VAVFLALYFSWSFGRGLFLALGFPSYLISFRSGIDVFPEVGIQYSSNFCAMALFGILFFLYFPSLQWSSSRRKEVTKALAGFVILFLLFAILLISVLQPSGEVYKVLVGGGAIIAPSSIGLFYRAYDHRFLQAITTSVALFMCVFLTANTAYWFGEDQGNELAVGRVDDWPTTGMASFKKKEFPIVSIVSPNKLPFMTEPRQTNDHYVYESSQKILIRLVFQNHFSHTHSGYRTVISRGRSEAPPCERVRANRGQSSLLTSGSNLR